MLSLLEKVRKGDWKEGGGKSRREDGVGGGGWGVGGRGVLFPVTVKGDLESCDVIVADHI